ncbi:MAG: hypothetical protein AAGU11_03060 [Syntrophobacteraceae bacterium]
MNTKGLRIWMIENDHTVGKIARDVGVTHAYVSLVISGQRYGEVVRKWFRDHGCPAEILEDDVDASLLREGEPAATAAA